RSPPSFPTRRSSDLIDTRRSIDVGGSQTLNADYHADALQLFSELAYALPVGTAAVLEPYAGASWQRLRAGRFAETGGQAALRGEDRKSTRLNSSHVK